MLFTHEHYDDADVNSLSAPGAGPLRMDAGESVFFARQLDFIKAKTYDKLYPELSGLRIVPITSEIPADSETYTYRSWDMRGIAKLISDYSQDLPRVDVHARETTIRLRDLGVSYGYTMREIRAAQYANVALESRRAAAARRAVMQKLNQIALVGDANVNMAGILNHPNIATVAVTGGWSTATPQAILADLNAMVNGVINQSNNIHVPNTMVLPVGARNQIFQQYIGANADRTIGEFFSGAMSKALGREFTIESAVELSGTFSPSGTNTAIVYEKSEDNMSLEVPEMFLQYAAQPRVLEWVVPCTARVAGFVLYYPLSICRATGL